MAVDVQLICRHFGLYDERWIWQVIRDEIKYAPLNGTCKKYFEVWWSKFEINRSSLFPSSSFSPLFQLFFSCFLSDIPHTYKKHTCKLLTNFNSTQDYTDNKRTMQHGNKPKLKICFLKRTKRLLDFMSVYHTRYCHLCLHICIHTNKNHIRFFSI